MDIKGGLGNKEISSTSVYHNENELIPKNHIEELESLVEQLIKKPEELFLDSETNRKLFQKFTGIFLSTAMIDSSGKAPTLRLMERLEANQNQLWQSIEILMRSSLKNISNRIRQFEKLNAKLSNGKEDNIANEDFMKTFVNIDNLDHLEIMSDSLLPCDSEVEDEKYTEKYLPRDLDSLSNKEVDFFNYDEMKAFIDEGIHEYRDNTTNNITDNIENTDDSDSYEEHADSEDYNLSDIKYEDFFGGKETKSKITKDNCIVDPVELKLEEAIRKYKKSIMDDLSKSEDQSTEISDNESGPDEELEKKLSMTTKPNKEPLENKGLSKLFEQQDRINKLIDEMESELISQKHWTMMGESLGNKRPKNSLLEVYLEIPQYSNTSNNSEEILDMEQSLGNDESEATVFTDDKLNDYIEKIVKQRISDGIFDDVESSSSLLAVQAISEVTRKTQDEVDLSVEKSRVGLGDIYAQKYQQEMGINPNVEADKNKQELVELFAKVMHKLDSLSNQRFVPKQISAETNALTTNVPAFKIEDTVPVIISEDSRLAPAEIKSMGNLVPVEEMSREERRAHRNASKEKRRKKLKGLVKSGNMSEKQYNERRVTLSNKNKQAKAEKISINETGLSVRDASKANRTSGSKRLKSHHFAISTATR
ncbi:MPP10 protein [Cryptosporidium andersoni]|uniref:MPP10 protein n=1 Tax=Cryptosporidium andersoni TaxID=117008 RepID=A0A1J4MGN0_9CRYT|nr:MPP10 protein [Cryptosporidium andersoni]